MFSFLRRLFMNDTSNVTSYEQNQSSCEQNLSSYEQNQSSYEFIDIPLPDDADAPPEYLNASPLAPPEDSTYQYPDYYDYEPVDVPQEPSAPIPQDNTAEFREEEPPDAPPEYSTSPLAPPEYSASPLAPYVPQSAIYGMEIPAYMRSAANVKPANHRFLLGDSRFPIGEIAIIAGAGGTGKGQFACTHMAYSSKGCNLLGERIGAPKRSLFISAEDTAEDIKRRLERSSFAADDRQILLIGKTESYQEEIDLSDRDRLGMLKDWILVSGADAVYIDPLQAFVGEFTDLSRQNHVRHIMHSLAAIAEETQCCIILIMHLNKRQQIVSAADLLCGSSDIVNASRSAMLLTNDFRDGDQDRRYLFHIKSNHARNAKALELNISSAGNRIVGESDVTAEDYVMAVNTRKTNKSARGEVDYERMFYKGVEEMIAEGKYQSTFREFVQRFAPTYNGKAKCIFDDITIRIEERLGYTIQTRTSNNNPIKFESERGFRLYKLS